MKTDKRSQPQIKNGDILLSEIGMLTLRMRLDTIGQSMDSDILEGNVSMFKSGINKGVVTFADSLTFFTHYFSKTPVFIFNIFHSDKS